MSVSEINLSLSTYFVFCASQSSLCSSAAVRARCPHGWRHEITMAASRCRPSRPDLTTWRPPPAAAARLACGGVAVHCAPTQPRGVFPLRHRHGLLVASPSLRPGLTSRRPTLAAGVRLFRGRVMRRCPRGLMSVARLCRRRHRHRCAPAPPHGILLSRQRRGLPAGAA